MIYKVTDMVTRATALVIADHLADVLQIAWFPDPPADVVQALNDLQDALLAGQPVNDLLATLQLKVEKHVA